MFNPCLKLIYKILELQSLSISRDHNLTSLKQGWFSRINVNIQKEETDKLAKKKKQNKSLVWGKKWEFVLGSAVSSLWAYQFTSLGFIRNSKMLGLNRFSLWRPIGIIASEMYKTCSKVSNQMTWGNLWKSSSDYSAMASWSVISVI